MDAYRAQREARLRAPQPAAAALDAKIGRITAEVDRAIAGLEAEYTANKGLAIETVLKVRARVRVGRCFFSPAVFLLPVPRQAH